MSQAASLTISPVSQSHASRLFVASCMALTGAAMMFAVSADIILDLKRQFILTNEDIGWVRSAGIGFTLAILLLGPLCDALGMGSIIALAFLCHTLGIVAMIFANGTIMLFSGFLLHNIGSGAIEAACNPLIATIFPDQKTHKLNQFHMWFPGGIVIGGVGAFLFTQLHLNWQLKLAFVLVPTLIYGVMFIGMKFPATERVQSGVSFTGMIKETLARPLFLVLLFCMMLTASLELGPNAWIPPVLEAGGIPGILVLVWITGLMAILRFFAGPVVRVLSNIGVLLLSAILAGAGLLMLSYSSQLGLSPAATTAFIGVAATIFAVGVCYFWPTMLGTAAERVPKGGAFALALLGGTGGLFVSLVTTPVMGRIIDANVYSQLVYKGPVGVKTVDRAQQTLDVLRQVDSSFSAYTASLTDSKQDLAAKKDVKIPIDDVRNILAIRQKDNNFPEKDLANVFRSISRDGPKGAADDEPLQPLKSARAARTAAEDLLNPAENKAGLISFRYVAPLSLILIVIFGILFLQDRQRTRQTIPPHTGN